MQDYIIEKTKMKPAQRQEQERFEQMINLLVIYKQFNPTMDVFLSESDINKAISWYQKMTSAMSNLSSEEINQITNAIQST
jgi:hypothetical protein